MKLRCAVLDDYQRAAASMADWHTLEDRVEYEFFHEHVRDEDDLAALLEPFRIIVAMRERTPFPASLLNRLPRLRLLVTTGMRNASIDLAAAAERGITVCGTGSSPQGTVELTWALILGLARHLVREHQAFVTNGPWQSTVGMSMRDKTLGILGLGRIGEGVAKVGRAFGMDVVAWSQHLTAERCRAAGVRLASSKAELLETADIVTIHLVLGERTRGLIQAEDLRRMKRTALLINTSRAAIVDQDALVDALRQRHIAGAAADVFAEEPLPRGHVLRTLPNLLATPHLGYVTDANYQRFYKEAVENIRAYLAGAPVRTLAPAP